jgi:hypothetical protein
MPSKKGESMKEPYQVTHCEFCNGHIVLGSPPSKGRYDSGEINISNSSILLPDAVVKKNHKKGIADGHASNINGIYCNYECLMKQIKKILHIKN